MPRNYVDNAYNRSAGRVGMPVGSAVISRSSGSSGGGGYSSSGNGGGGYSSSGYGGGSSGASYSSSSGSGTYVDNAYNRSAGRVGMPIGTAVISRSSGEGSSFGLSGVSSGGGDRTYVDNAFNRREGRVGLPIGTAVISRSSGGGESSASSSSKVYVDNAHNRSAGRVGMPMGTAVISKSSGSVSSTGNTKSGVKCYADNDYNRRLGRAGMAFGTHAVSSSARTSISPASSKRYYVDNAMNRRLGRVGKEIGTAIYSHSGKTSNPGSVIRHYVTIRQQACPEIFAPLYDFDPEDPALYKTQNQFQEKMQEYMNDPEMYHKCETALGIINRHDAAITQHKMESTLIRPEWLKGGEIVEWNELEIGEKLGSGGFGDVHIAIWKGKHQVVVKKLRVQRVHEKKRLQFEQEVKTFSALSHPAIVEFYGACVKTPNICIVMEFMAGGSLYDVLHVECRPLSKAQKISMTGDILSALEYLHAQDIAHRDVKSMNVLVAEDLDHCKLGDFGLALKEETTCSSSIADFAVVGTIRYSSPEMLNGERLILSGLKAADVYATTLTVYELWAEEEPWQGMNQHQVRKAVLDGERPDVDNCSGNVPFDMRVLVSEGWKQRAGARLSASRLREKFDEIKDTI